MDKGVRKCVNMYSRKKDVGYVYFTAYNYKSNQVELIINQNQTSATLSFRYLL